MTLTIRNVDEDLYKELKAQAARQGKTVGEATNEAFELWLKTIQPQRGTLSWDEMPTFDFGPGSERLSEQIDEVAYGEDSH